MSVPWRSMRLDDTHGPHVCGSDQRAVSYNASFRRRARVAHALTSVTIVRMENTSTLITCGVLLFGGLAACSSSSGGGGTGVPDITGISNASATEDAAMTT